MASSYYSLLVVFYYVVDRRRTPISPIFIAADNASPPTLLHTPARTNWSPRRSKKINFIEDENFREGVWEKFETKVIPPGTYGKKIACVQV